MDWFSSLIAPTQAFTLLLVLNAVTLPVLSTHITLAVIRGMPMAMPASEETITEGAFIYTRAVVRSVGTLSSCQIVSLPQPQVEDRNKKEMSSVKLRTKNPLAKLSL